MSTLSTLQQALRDAYEDVGTFDLSAARVVGEGTGYGEAEGDIEIAADRLLGNAVAATLITSGGEKTIDIEGRETIFVTSGVYNEERKKILHSTTKESAYLAIDPLDGSLNFKRRSGSTGLPYATVIAKYPRLESSFSDCSEAGVIDLRNGDMWHADEGTCQLNSRPCKTSGMQRVAKSAGTTIIADFYYPETRDVIAKGFSDFRGYIRSPGAAGYELALVASGSVDAFISTHQKCDVLGAAYLLITRAGGVIVDFEGNDLGPRRYDFNTQIPVVAAATTELAMEILERIR